MVPQRLNASFRLLWLAGWCVTGLELALSGGSLLAGEIFPDAPTAELLWKEGEFTEGVAVRADGQVFFSDIGIGGTHPGRILQFDPSTNQTRVVVANSAQSNGLFFDADGRLLACCGANGGARALVRVEADGTLTNLADVFEGQRFNAPNDLVVHPQGWFYFSDPRYVGPEPLELNHQSVFQFTPFHLKLEGTVRRVTTDISKPNGLIGSPDGKTLYVAETDNGSTGAEPSGPPPGPVRMTLCAFTVTSDGSLENKRILVDFGAGPGIDGMTMDAAGRIYGAVRNEARHGIAVYDPAGQEIDFLPLSPLPTNCTFGVPGEKAGQAGTAQVLYITAGTGLYRISTTATGWHPNIPAVKR